MKRIKLRYKILGAIAFIIFILLFLLSTFVKNYVVKHSQELIKRKVTLNELHFNYFRVSVRMRDFVMYEANQADRFVSFDELYINFDPWALLHNEYSFAQITLINPNVHVSQNMSSFNFDDLLKSTSDTTSVSKKKEPTDTTSFRFTVKNLQMKNGLLSYEDKKVKSYVELKNLNLNVPLISWDSRQSNMGISFRIGDKGDVEINAQLDNKAKKYTILLNTKTLSIEPIKNYMKDYLDVTYFGGLLTSKIKINGDFEQTMNINVSGKVLLDSLLINDGRNNKLIAIDRVETNISNINLYTTSYNLSSIVVTNPKIVATLDRDMTNFERVLKPYFKADSLATPTDTTKKSSTSNTSITYRLDTLKIINGDIEFTDNTLNRPFSYSLSNLNFSLMGLTESATKIPITYSVITNKTGNISGKMILNMMNAKNFDMEMKIKRLDLLSFSPYSEYYIASPITQGLFNYDFNLQMTPVKLSNQNKIRVEELEFGKRTKDSTAIRVPVKLALYILKDQNDIIAFDLPIEGNPSEPKFSYSKIVWKTLGNFLVKTAAAPFNALAGLVSSNPEDLEKLPFNYTQTTLDEKQKLTLVNIAQIMKKKPNLIFRFTQFTDLVKEKEYIAVQRTEREYLLSTDATADSAKLARMIKNLKPTDASFLNFIRTREPMVDSLEIGATCTRLYNSSELDAQLNLLIAERNNQVKNFLKSENIPSEMLEVLTADLNNVPEELKFPHFKIEVSIK